MKHKSLCIIPARGGSKRIPRKNVRDFIGMPIIAHSIQAAKRSELFDEVIVSTDDSEIAEIARFHGASVPFMRSTENSSDNAPLKDVIVEVLDSLRTNDYELVCCLLPTAALTTPKQLIDAQQQLTNNDFLTVRPIVEFSYPIQRAFQLEGNGEINWVHPEHASTRSQDLPPRFHDAGQFYWMYAASGLASEKRGAIILNEWETHDIDNESDWIVAELKYKAMLNR